MPDWKFSLLYFYSLENKKDSLSIPSKANRYGIQIREFRNCSTSWDIAMFIRYILGYLLVNVEEFYEYCILLLSGKIAALP